jgi:signal transduction histidine kinase
VSFDEDVKNIDGDYFALTASVHGGRMTIALSAEPLEDIQDAFLAVFLFSLIPTTLIVVGGGVFLARRTVKRLDQIDTTLDRLTNGDFAARVAPMKGRADDLTRIGARVDKMAAAQEQQISALKQVSADIAHDLKTPIQRVSVLLNQLQGKGNLDKDSANLVIRANAETDGIVKTFQALLQIAQIEGGSPKKRFEPVDITALARTFCEVYEPSAEETGHVLIRDVPDGPIFVSGDKSLLGQVFANLIENALRHTPKGTTISVGIALDRGAVCLSVSDTGPGIPADERENVLRRLYRLERSRTTSGNGLGLSLVAAIVDIHEGALQLADNHPGLKVVIRLQKVEAADVSA